MVRHTPGPWSVVLVGALKIKADSTPGYFATIEGACAGAHGAEGEANARLIAAAPELLAALESLVSAPDAFPPPGEFSDTARKHREARALIARIRGSK